MKNKMISITICLYLFLGILQPLYAESSYVLPYPSVMPGSINYKIHLIWETLMKYWYYGSFGQFEYNLKESDKYLVEAKTLFEYQQYLLGYTALQKSNSYFSQTLPFLEKAKKEEKDINGKRILLHEAALKHIEVLKIMQSETPQIVTWSPEKSMASHLDIKSLIQASIIQRKNDL